MGDDVSGEGARTGRSRGRGGPRGAWRLTPPPRPLRSDERLMQYFSNYGEVTEAFVR